MNLLYSLERWKGRVDGEMPLNVVCIDLTEAFDGVPHPILLHNLSRTGVRGNFLKCIRSFLFGRSLTDHLGDQRSAEVAVECCVPRGSVLGPTSFIVYVNDCIHKMDLDIAIFADDNKL
ncbi:unnamed protein product [Dibothriocephalus latus]|uniref:Reverse transcriptase domain-containing protein n=1 Tax=Dibothriocephalus latus TaxID=60516 RepID=A0A3P6QFC9_DIBLA|nr:unnamed protein product [Dibothriocephalus latus]